MSIITKEITIYNLPRGFHIITDNIIKSTKNWTIKKKIINYSDHYPLFTKINQNHDH